MIQLENGSYISDTSVEWIKIFFSESDQKWVVSLTIALGNNDAEEAYFIRYTTKKDAEKSAQTLINIIQQRSLSHRLDELTKAIKKLLEAL